MNHAFKICTYVCMYVLNAIPPIFSIAKFQTNNNEENDMQNKLSTPYESFGIPDSTYLLTKGIKFAIKKTLM